MSSLPTHPTASFVRRNPHIYGEKPHSVVRNSHDQAEIGETAQKPKQKRPSPNEDKHHRQIPGAQPERHTPPTLDATRQRETKGICRTILRITGYRVHPLDADNFAGGCKDIIDGLRHAGLIQGDSFWQIRLETEQVKVKHYEDEKLEIEIDDGKN